MQKLLTLLTIWLFLFSPNEPDTTAKKKPDLKKQLELQKSLNKKLDKLIIKTDTLRNDSIDRSQTRKNIRLECYDSHSKKNRCTSSDD